jgi:kumamolisin
MPKTNSKKNDGQANSAHAVVSGSQRPVLPGARAIGPANPDEWIEVTLKLRRKAPLPDFTGRPRTILSRADLAARYGAADEDIRKTEKTAERFGLEVIRSDPGTRSVRVAGPLSAIEAAFQVKLFRYAHASGNYRGRSGVLHVPSELAGIVTGVFGLDDRRVVRRRRSHRQAVPLAATHAAHRSWFFPSELASLYDFPAGDGSGQTIGLIEFGGGYFPDDLAAFCQVAGVSVPNVVPISILQTPTDQQDGAEGEVMLDVEVVAGICPKARIPVYFSQFTEQGWVEVLDAAVHDEQNQPSVLSISWGLAEDDPAWSSGARDAINEALKEAALVGMTICVASGDDGSDDQVGDGHAHVDFPAASPYVLSVGGTTLRRRNGKVAETAWKDGDGLRADGGGSTGGGVSRYFNRPTWQTVNVTSVNPGAIAGRCVPDVAADASGHTGYFVVVDGNGGASGGTSASAPLWAALIARINAGLSAGKQVGYLTPLLYQPAPGSTAAMGAASCRDIISGDNVSAAGGGYFAQPGYDAVTGWGVPMGSKLLQNLGSML